MALISCNYLNWSLNGSIFKKVSKMIVFHWQQSLPIFSIFEHFEKTLDFERLYYPNHLTHMSSWGISKKILSISFIWYHVVPCVTTSLATNGSWKVGRLSADQIHWSLSSIFRPLWSIESCIESNRVGLPITPIPDWFFGTFAARIFWLVFFWNFTLS